MTIDTNALGAVRPSRRAVVRGAAWSVPVVSMAVTAPAYAASTCRDGAYQIRWASDFNGTTKIATANRISTSGTGSVGNAALTMTVTSKFNGTMQAGSKGGYSNLNVSPDNIGGLGTHGLTIMQRSSQRALETPRANQNQVVTLTFSRPVWDLKFTLTDIDALSGQYQDRIMISSPPASYTLASQVSGGGTSGSPWAPTGTDIAQDPVTGAGGNVNLDYTGSPAASVYILTYWNDQSGNLSSNGLQGVFVSNMTFSSETC